MSVSAPPPAGLASVSAIIPCLNEEESIGAVIRAVISHGVAEAIVVDGGSTDDPSAQARGAGARVVVEPRRGYGQALLTGIAAARPESQVLLFLDGDGSDRVVVEPRRGYGRCSFMAPAHAVRASPAVLAWPSLLPGLWAVY